MVVFIFCFVHMCSGRLAYIISNTGLYRGHGYRKYQGFHCVLITTRLWYILYRKCVLIAHILSFVGVSI